MKKVKITVKKYRYLSTDGRVIVHTSYSISLPKDILKEAGILDKDDGETLTINELVINVKEIDGKPALVLTKP